ETRFVQPYPGRVVHAVFDADRRGDRRARDDARADLRRAFLRGSHLVELRFGRGDLRVQPAQVDLRGADLRARVGRAARYHRKSCRQTGAARKNTVVTVRRHAGEPVDELQLRLRRRDLVLDGGSLVLERHELRAQRALGVADEVRGDDLLDLDAA